ncbi:hypothetical protein DB346_04995 [Verrucomicrobia bacterium LW23]|nr:hypothetical protein DB346_04995 [Verrucomicrobia bacterium LW23]
MTHVAPPYVLDTLELLRRHMGLDPASLGVGALAQAVATAAAAEGMDPAHYAETLPADGAMLHRLVERIVVPETHFFRHPGAFVAMRRWLEAARVRRGVGSVVHALSAPCSTGEEAYSIAIELHESGLEFTEFAVRGLDISLANIQSARAGTYGGKAFREERARELRERYFHTAPPSDAGEQWQIHAELAARVSFIQTNVLAPDLAETLPRFDLIFCRNLLIYLDNPSRRRVLHAMKAMLHPQGLLFVGPAEMGEALDAGFARAPYEMAFACMSVEGARALGVTNRTAPAPALPKATARPREDVSVVSPKTYANIPAPAPAAATLTPATSQRANASASPLPSAADRPKPPIASPATTGSPAAPSPPPAPAAAGADACAEAWALANAGKLDDARAAVRRVLAATPNNADAHALQGILQEGAGDKPAAEASYRKALFLNPFQSSALLSLALLLEATNRAEAAQPLRARAARRAAAEKASAPGTR